MFAIFFHTTLHISVSSDSSPRRTSHHTEGRGQLKCDGTRAETRFRLSAKRTSPFKSARASVQSTTGSRGVRISGSNAGYTMFRGSVKGTGYPLHSPVSPSLPLPCVTACHHISTGVYYINTSSFISSNKHTRLYRLHLIGLRKALVYVGQDIARVFCRWHYSEEYGI